MFKHKSTESDIERDYNLLTHEGKKILAKATFFTLCAIKSWRAAAIESFHSVSAGPVVLTGMACTVIDICKGKR